MEIGQVYSGKEFNASGIKPLKMLRTDLKHYGHQYRLGLNKDRLPFNPSGDCSHGGLYFCTEENLPKFLRYGTTVGHFTIPKNAKVYVEHEKFKCDKMILEKIVLLEEFLNDGERALNFVKQNGLALEFVKNQTPEICLAAVKQNGLALEFVKNQTRDICLAAVNQEPYALQFIKNQTPEICLAAVNQYGHCLQLVRNRTHEICLAAVKQCGDALQYVKDQTLEICLAAVKKNRSALMFVHQHLRSDLQV